MENMFQISSGFWSNLANRVVAGFKVIWHWGIAGIGLLLSTFFIRVLLGIIFLFKISSSVYCLTKFPPPSLSIYISSLSSSWPVCTWPLELVSFVSREPVQQMVLCLAWTISLSLIPWLTWLYSTLHSFTCTHPRSSRENLCFMFSELLSPFPTLKTLCRFCDLV